MPSDPVNWVRYAARPWLIRVASLSPAAELAHRRLADSVWATGQWPLASGCTPATLGRVAPEAWPKVLAELRTAGWHRSGGRLRHAAVGRLLTEARQAMRRASLHGTVASKARWTKPPDARRMPAACPLDSPGTAPAIPAVSTLRNIKKYSDKAFNVTEHSMRSVSVRSKGTPGEKGFLGDLEAAFTAFNPKTAATEMANWGGWWRNRYRENPAKARRILAEMRCMITEGRVLSTPGAAAHDLWPRWPA